MKNLKKIVALLLAIVMIVGVFAACGNKPGTSDPGNTGKPGTSTPNGDKPGTTEPSYETRDVGGLKLPLSEKKEELTVWLEKEKLRVIR